MKKSFAPSISQVSLDRIGGLHKAGGEVKTWS
jgi:hypothetical protein